MGLVLGLGWGGGGLTKAFGLYLANCCRCFLNCYFMTSERMMILFQPASACRPLPIAIVAGCGIH